MEELERIAPIAVICAVLGCASSTQPTETPPPPPPSEPSSEPASEPATGASSPESTGTSTSASSKTGDRSGNDGKWEGEEAAANKPVERTAAETRTTPVIQKIVLDNRQTVRDCYDRGRKELPDLKGKMTIKFVLDPDGRVKTAELLVAESEIKAPAVVNCSIEAIKRMKFPPSSRGMDTTVNYPFDFKPQGSGKP